MFFGDLYRNTIRTAQVNRYGWTRDAFHLFLLESMQQNKPYDQMAREMLAAEGTSDGRTYPERYTDYAHYESTYLDYDGNPAKASAVGYIVGGRTIGGPIQDTYDTLAFITARDFLGISTMDCVLCHDGAGHLEGLSNWGTAAKRYDGWELASFFSDIRRYQSWRVPGNTLPNNPNNGRRVNANYYLIYDLPEGRTQVTRGGDTAGEYLAQTEGGNRPDRLNDERYVMPSYPLNQSATPVDGTLRLRDQLTRSSHVRSSTTSGGSCSRAGSSSRRTSSTCTGWTRPTRPWERWASSPRTRGCWSGWRTGSATTDSI